MKIKFLALILLGVLLLTGCTTEATTVTVTQTVTKTVTQSITVTQTIVPTTTATTTTTPIDTENLPIPTPANGAVNIPVSTPFKWQAIDGATEYEIEISEDTLMNSIAYKASTSVNYHQLRQGFNLFPMMNYYWRVRAVSPVLSEWQNYSFTTRP